MARYIEGSDRHQPMLLPAAVDDYVFSASPVRAIDAFVDSLDLPALGFKTRNDFSDGRSSYHPGSLLKLYLWGYLKRTRSSRGLENACAENLQAIWLTGNLRPDHSTISDFTAKSLQAPFALHTRFAKGGGDPEFERFLGYITLADGKDLGSVLVQQGLARARGIISTLPDGMAVVEARGMLQDLEIQALKKDRGIWAKTNWEKLPAERQLQRKEIAEAQIVKDQNAPGPDFKIDPNLANRKQLMDLKGIGDILADRIIEERKKAPFLKAEDLLRVERLTKPTLEKIRPHLVFPKS